jgi:transcriptional regulator with XRE-family HTH domain
MDQTAQNLQQQVELYGETLGDVVRRVAPALGLTQSALAQVIGLSAPMLSQLMSAQRVKIGNPAVVSRLRAVSQLADLAIASEIDPDEIPTELDRIRGTTGAFPSTGPNTVHVPRSVAFPPGRPLGHPSGHSQAHASGQSTDPAAVFASPAGLQAPASQPWPPATPPDLIANTARAVVREIQDLFREIASADEIQRAAAAAAKESPAVAELLLAYGTGRTADAMAHYEKHHG